ncbi:hypothetical protein N7474_008919 [Penicillium riverlandense]|uniref:uncharacterized protein n=1 Tax=Penicillium riverlandense TaxID=1903569 RepID=UPI002548E90C|nr:uncharacterized protein N7474_008919 [Penicillium riverlandense]KAJ5812618.1 hypothetical protein N7474_008919 [Penicillium riverlandense]
MLSSEGVNFNNETEASDFLSALLDDSVFQLDGNTRARYFWYGIAALIGVMGVWNLCWRIDLHLRFRAIQSSNKAVSGPFAKVTGTIACTARRLTYPQVTPAGSASWFKVPALGIIYLVLAYILFILLLQFVGDDVAGPTWYTFVGVRAGWLAVAQLPLIILLVGRHSLIGLITGVSYERLNVLHRWVSRGLLLLATFHVAFLASGWSRFPGLQSLEWATDEAFRSGVANYTILVWINISTIAPLRHLSYEFFVIQHVITYFGLIIACAYHIPGSAKYARVYIYVAVALYLVERLVYFFRCLFNNSVSSQVTLESLEGGVTKIYASNRRIKTWAPGSHVMISLPRFGLFQSHPATIMSIPSSHNGDMVLLLRAYKGFTKRIYEADRTNQNTTSTDGAVQEKQPRNQLTKYMAFVNGPYGASHAEFAYFDTVLLIAGATGVTFAMSVLLDVAHRAASVAEGNGKPLPIRKVTLIWMVRNSAWVEWITEELQIAVRDLENAGILFGIQVFVTKVDESDATLTNSPALRPQILAKDAEKTPKQTKNHSILGLGVESGRPMWDTLFQDTLSGPNGESAVGVCGPLSLSVEVRRKVVALNSDSNRRVYLHVESFS